MFTSALETVAARIREKAGLVEPPFSTRKIVKEAFPGLLVAGATLPPGVDEVVTVGPDGPVILYNRKLPTPHQRFSIAHGLGHVLFDFAELRGELFRNRRERKEREERAEAFAAELLVPLGRLTEYVRDAEVPLSPSARQAHLDMVDELASQFQVSQKVVHRRIRDLRRERKRVRRHRKACLHTLIR